MKLETGILEEKRQEIAETEKMKNKLVNMIKEMPQKINEVQVELEEKRMEIENIGSDIMELILEMEGGGINKEERMKIEGGGINKEERMKIEEKKTEKENEKMNRLEEFNRKKNGVMKLMQKKEEMEVKLDLVKRYLIKYRRDVRQKERRAIVELVLSSDEEVDKEKQKKQRVSIVSNSLKLSRTFSHILKTSYVYMYIFH